MAACAVPSASIMESVVPPSTSMTVNLAAALLGLALAGSATAQPPADQAVDYGQAAAWVCRPGAETVCVAGLDAVMVTADGRRTPETFVPADHPPIDCIYVYPTISRQPTPFSDMTRGVEEEDVTRAQAGRLTSRCRLFAPLYRQLTLAGLGQGMAGDAPLDWRGPYDDVRNAWRWYMAHENHGRGVVLIGHSQGAILLQRLIAEEIDGKPAEKRLVSAFLAGDPALPVPRGSLVGGGFKHVPLCAQAAQTGCVYVWGTYLADDADPARKFGQNPPGGLVAACANPAAPAGGPGLLEAYMSKPKIAPKDDPPWVRLEGQLSGACVADAQGAALRVTILPTPFAELLDRGFKRYALGPGWGLHRLDLSLPQGNILDVVDAETRSWTQR
jgi:hypothetical protein